MRGVLASLSVLVLALVTGCGAGDAMDTGASHRDTDHAVSVASKKPPVETVAASRCQPDLPSCRTTEGRITFVESVDADGDGDAHFVIVDSQGITLPGLTAIDVRMDLRPHPLPEVGDLISAAGPVQTGSYGQSQIHALELHVAG